jgi:hypothetical protein
MTDTRPFRAAVTEAEARQHLARWAALEFDPRVVHVFLSLKGLAELRSYAGSAGAPGAGEQEAGGSGAEMPPTL